MVETLQGGQRPLPFAVGIRVVDEPAFEYGSDEIHERMVDDPVAEIRGANRPSLGISDSENSERPRLVDVGHQFPLQFVEVVFEVLLEFEDIGLLRFPPLGVLECEEKVVVAGYPLEEMTIGLHGRIITPKYGKPFRNGWTASCWR